MGNNSSATITRSEISAGDHLHTSRLRLFDNHGIYIGENRVIHFQNSVDDKALRSGSSIHRQGPCRVCGHHSGRSGVVLSCLDCFLRCEGVYRYEYGYGQLKLGQGPQSGLMKWCTSAGASDFPETVIDRAKELLRDGFGKYDLITNNCEDFALFCKTGKRIGSGQVALPACLPAMIIACFLPFMIPYIDSEDIPQAK